MTKLPIKDSLNKKAEILEVFVDSASIGEKGRSKVEINKYQISEDIYLSVKFYKKESVNWSLQNNYLFETNSAIALKPDISDFSNDKLNDITVTSNAAGRGANELRRLFIYDDKSKKLISITNSEDFPNMEYNAGLNCIDAFALYGVSCSTVFAKIELDSLREIARVDCEEDGKVSVYETDKLGRRKLIKKKIMEDASYTRFTNYNPLTE
ncbi:hypothetical protein IM792_08850 [Mucilaginibacter sp. JRF]|uniref:hypothetical protein n=1 Tax=Mucilaginibacter sp. JRF TaxID=2780088 RepID=UPI00188149DE|nr:hypothetical protein [Mucilaginibacter sp. JRF]MBE9584551.1 hypothetical protein [Mucilaginibacter sp. JRF]